MKRVVVTDRTTGEVVGEVDRGEATTRAQADGGRATQRSAIVLSGAPTTQTGRGLPSRTDTHRIDVVLDGWHFEFEVEDADRAALRARATRDRGANAQHGPTNVRAIIPGRVLTVAVVPGDVVTAGQQLLTVEAMKMQNELRAPRDGTVDRVTVGPGATVEPGDLLLVLT